MVGVEVQCLPKYKDSMLALTKVLRGLLSPRRATGGWAAQPLANEPGGYVAGYLHEDLLY
jgi:hypothetical protein